MIKMVSVQKKYSMGQEAIRALDNVCLSIQSNEFVSIIGPSGSGKSTLMNILGCLDVPDTGDYYLDGIATKRLSEAQLAKVRSQKVGFVFQGFNLLSKLTAEQNVELPLIYQRITSRDRRKRVNDALARVGLAKRRNHRPSELSGGQQQRVAIARVLAAKPTIILADEPTGNLDSKTSEEIMSLFHELHRNGNTIILVTHDSYVASQADRCIAMLDGKIVEDSRC